MFYNDEDRALSFELSIVRIGLEATEIQGDSETQIAPVVGGIGEGAYVAQPKGPLRRPTIPLSFKSG